MIVSLSGNPGSGKSTVSKIVQKKLKIKRFYMGQIFRDIAKKRGINLLELNKLSEKDPEIDREVDNYILELGKSNDNFIIESRTAFHFLPKSIKIFLNVSPDVGAQRIFNHLQSEEGSAQRNEGEFSSVEEVKKNIKKVEDSYRKRFQTYYDIIFDDPNNFDLIIDSSNLSPDEVAKKIVDFVKENKD